MIQVSAVQTGRGKVTKIVSIVALMLVTLPPLQAEELNILVEVKGRMAPLAAWVEVAPAGQVEVGAIVDQTALTASRRQELELPSE